MNLGPVNPFEIGSPLSGEVKEILLKEGESAEAGDLVIKIETNQ